VRRLEERPIAGRAAGTILRRRPKSIDVAAGDGTAVRVFFDYPLRSWAKLLLLQAATRRLNRLGP
jgi:hypothetical protein